MNLLEYKINWSSHSSFQKKTFLEQYYFLHVSAFHLTSFPDKANFNFKERRNEPISIPEPIDENDPRLNRAINLCISYLEQYCDYDHILREIRNEYEGTLYSELSEMGIEWLQNRLKQVLFNTILYLNNNSRITTYKWFNKTESLITPDQIESYLLVKKHLDPIYKSLINLIDKPYTELLEMVVRNGTNDSPLRKAKQRIELDEYLPLDNGIHFESFISPTKVYNSYSLRGISYNPLQSRVARALQFIYTFDVTDFHHHIQIMTEALIKLGVRSEMMTSFQTKETYVPHYFTVNGPQDAVNKYGTWMIERYELSNPGSLRKKIEAMCYKIDSNKSKVSLKGASIMRAILRNNLFPKNSNIS